MRNAADVFINGDFSGEIYFNGTKAAERHPAPKEIELATLDGRVLVYVLKEEREWKAE